MITEEQRDRLTTQDVLAILTENYRLEKLNYTLLKGTVVEIRGYVDYLCDLFIDGKCVDIRFPYDAAELLE